MGVTKETIRSRSVAVDCKKRLEAFLHSPTVSRQTNEAKSTQLTVLKAVVPAAPAEGADEAEKKKCCRMMKDFLLEFELKGGMRRRAEEAFVLRKEFDLKEGVVDKVIETYKRRSPCTKRVTPQLKADFISWCINISETVVNTPNKKDFQIARDPITDEKLSHPENPDHWLLQRKCKCQGSLQRLHNEAILPQAQGGCPGFTDETGRVWIGLEGPVLRSHCQGTLDC